MKAMDDALINGKEVQLRVSNCQRLLDEKRRAEKRQKCCNSLINLKRDKDFRLAHSILNSNNSTMNNSNNTTNTSHNSSTTTTSSIVNNSNNSTNTTTTSSNNSGDSNCNNIHNNNINIHDTMQKGWIRIKVCLYNNSMTFLHADEWSLSSFPWHISSTSSLLWSRSGSSFFGHVSCLCRSYLLQSNCYQFYDVVDNCGNVYFWQSEFPEWIPWSIISQYFLWCTGICDNNWLITFKQALSIYLSGGSLCQGYNSQFDHVSEWYAKQRNMKPQLEKEKQDLLGVIGIWFKAFSSLG